MTKKITLQKLERLLLQACDIMRAEIESSDYKKYIFAMIFLKRLSDQFEAEQKKIIKDNSDKSEKVLLKKLNDKDNYPHFSHIISNGLFTNSFTLLLQNRSDFGCSVDII